MGTSTLLIISVATLHTLCHGSPLGIGNLDLKLRTPEGRNFNPVQFAEEWVESVSLPVIPVVKNVQFVPVAKAVPVPYRSTPVHVQRKSIQAPVPFRSTPVLVQRETIQEPVVTQYVQPAAIIPQPTVKSAPLVVKKAPVDVKSTSKSGPIITKTQSVLLEPVLKQNLVNVKLTPIVIKPAKVAQVVIEPASIVYEHIEVSSANVKSAPIIVEIVAESIAPVVIPKIVETEPIKTLSSVTPNVNIISPASPIVNNAPTKGSIPILRPIPVVTGNSIQTVEPKPEVIIVENPRPIAPVALPVIKAEPEVIVSPVVNSLPEVLELPAVSATPEVILALGPEPLDAPNPPLPTGDVPFRGGQFHAQDESGQYAFGYYGGSSTRVEAKDSLGRVSGSFAYVNPDGDIQVRKYSSAPGVGFKVAASDLPVDTPEVAEVKEAHAKLIADTRASNL